ncbi:MAG: ATP-binding cassette domain-containing protein [Lachnospiraceae bacterium]|nr:ATP-binding cassette domain-containing protein [Lachnospiraceae bacterium]
MNYVIVKDVVKRFGAAEILHGVNMTLEQGKIYGIIGNNGSGKTVLMKCICGFLPVTSGEILVNGRRIGKDIDFPDSLGAIIETPGFLNNLTGRKNLEILAQLKGRIGRREIKEVLRQVGLDPELKKKVSQYSLGMRQRLGIAQAIMEDPKLLILDEPFNGLDKHGVDEIRQLILKWKAQGKTILLASHNGEDIRVLCDEVFEMDAGNITCQAVFYQDGSSMSDGSGSCGIDNQLFL